MSTNIGLLFLVGGIAVFAITIVLINMRDKVTQRPRQTVAHFERSRNALGKIHRNQTVLWQSARARARAMHPSGRGKRNRKSA